jgi:peptide deformylase
MTAQRLQELLAHAWDTFYQDESQQIKMSKLFARVIRKEMDHGTHRPRRTDLRRQAFGKPVV